MHLTVIRHAKAIARDKWHHDDADRPLTKDGIAQAEKAFRLLLGCVGITEVWTSPWVRARQTTEIACEIWNLPLREVDWLAGNGTAPGDWPGLLPKKGDIALVGHEPDLGILLGTLLGGGRPLPLKKGGVALLEGPDLGHLTLQQLLSPKLLSAVAENA